jgi:hypothetical protein
MTTLMPDVPAYIEERIRQPRPNVESTIKGSTPVVAFGDVRKSTVATLGLNPSKLEFLNRDGSERMGDQRRLETLASLEVNDLCGGTGRNR